jgi:gamma-glutamyltranspeptidase/glutathione hydrolase
MIITTVLQTLVNNIDFHEPLPRAIAAPRASQRNTASVIPEPAFAALEGGFVQAHGHKLGKPAEIGATTGIRFLRRGRQQAAAEPERRGGGSAMVVEPD